MTPKKSEHFSEMLKKIAAMGLSVKSKEFEILMDLDDDEEDDTAVLKAKVAAAKAALFDPFGEEAAKKKVVKAVRPKTAIERATNAFSKYMETI